MHALVVYESLWGNTRAVAEAIAEGIGNDAQALSTSSADAATAGTVDLLVVGAPVHAFNLPTAAGKDSVAARPVPQGALAPDVSHPPLREWLKAAGTLTGAAAAFDTRVKGPLGRGGAKRIEKLLSAAGAHIAAPGEGFLVINQKHPTAPATMLVPGELERARLWGAALMRAVDA